MRRRVFTGCVPHRCHATPDLKIACGRQLSLLVQILAQLASIQIVDYDISGEGRRSCIIYCAIFVNTSAQVYGA